MLAQIFTGVDLKHVFENFELFSLGARSITVVSALHKKRRDDKRNKPKFITKLGNVELKLVLNAEFNGGKDKVALVDDAKML